MRFKTITRTPYWPVATHYIPMCSSILFDTLHARWFILHIKSQKRPAYYMLRLISSESTLPVKVPINGFWVKMLQGFTSVINSVSFYRIQIVLYCKKFAFDGTKAQKSLVSNNVIWDKTSFEPSYHQMQNFGTIILSGFCKNWLTF